MHRVLKKIRTSRLKRQGEKVKERNENRKLTEFFFLNAVAMVSW